MPENTGVTEQRHTCFVAVHVGAGYHANRYEGAYNQGTPGMKAV